MIMTFFWIWVNQQHCSERTSDSIVIIVLCPWVFILILAFKSEWLPQSQSTFSKQLYILSQFLEIQDTLFCR